MGGEASKILPGLYHGGSNQLEEPGFFESNGVSDCASAFNDGAPDPVLRGTSSTQQAEACVHDDIFRLPKYFLCAIAGPPVSVAISSLSRFWRLSQSGR